MNFRVLKESFNNSSRIGEIHIKGKKVMTPLFMPVGTKGTIKTLDSSEIKDINDGIILCNTYHLWLSPGTEVLKSSKGIHKLIQYKGLILTDSGGFQVYSLSENRKIKEEGVYFKNPINGDSLFLSPEMSIQIQRVIGSDIYMCLDECPGTEHSYNYLEDSVNLTTRWAKRCKETLVDGECLFGIIQGGIHETLREKSADEIINIDFDGYAIGGLSVGEPKSDMYRITNFLNTKIPKDKPRYLMGVGGIDDILENIKNGIDMFDCVMQTRNARHGMFYTMEGHFNIKQSIFEFDFSPLDTLINHKYSKYKKAYLRHLFKENEILVYRILTYHNLMFMKYFMNQVRNAILNDKLDDFIENIKKNTNYYK